MAKTPMYDPLSSEARSPWLAGLTDACNKLSGVLDMHTDSFVDLPLSAVDDRRLIFQAPLGNKVWLTTPAPVFRKNGNVITPMKDNFTIDYLGGSIAFNPDAVIGVQDIITCDATYIVEGSTVIDDIISSIEDISGTTSKYKGYFTSLDALESSLPSGVAGDYAIVGGDDNSLYVWNSTSKKWENTWKETDLSDYYNKTDTDALLSQKENNISPKGTDSASDNFYYGGRKTWQDLSAKVREVTLTGLDDSTAGDVTSSDTILSAFGKLQAQVKDYVHDIFGSGDPTTSTVGEIGQDYTNTSNGNKFHLLSKTGTNYKWAQYQDKLEFDSEPTEDSENILSSGTIYSSLDEKFDKSGGTVTGLIKVVDKDDDTSIVEINNPYYSAYPNIAFSAQGHEISFAYNTNVDESICISAGFPSNTDEPICLHGVAEPYDDTDAANKQYVDDCVEEVSSAVANKATTTTIRTTLPSSSWTTSGSILYKEITVINILATDDPIIDVMLLYNDVNSNKAILEAWSKIDRIVTSASKITAYTYGEEAPSVNIPIQIKVVR